MVGNLSDFWFGEVNLTLKWFKKQDLKWPPKNRQFAHFSEFEPDFEACKTNVRAPGFHKS